MTSFRKIVDDTFKSLPSYTQRTDAIIAVIEALADEMDRRYPQNLVVGDITEEMIDSLNNSPGVVVPNRGR